MALSLYEQETVITFNAEEDCMEIYTAYPPLMRQLSKRKTYTKIKEDKMNGKIISMTFKADKKLLTLRASKPKSTMTEEQKEMARQRLLKIHSKRSNMTAGSETTD